MGILIVAAIMVVSIMGFNIGTVGMAGAKHEGAMDAGEGFWAFVVVAFLIALALIVFSLPRG